MSPRDKVLIDHPTYPHAITTFTQARARLLPVALTPSGWDAEQLRAAGRTAQLAYLIPDFHNPTGMCMPSSVRERLALPCVTVVDETMTDLALDAPSPEPLAAHLPAAISVGSVSKSIWGGLRTGWIRAAPAVLERVARARPTTDLGTPVVEQLATAVLLNDRRTRRTDTLGRLREQRDALRRALTAYLPDVHFTCPEGGLTLWAAFPDAISSRLAAIAPDFGVTIAAGPRFGIGGAFARHIRLPYTLPSERLTTAVRALADAEQALRRGTTGTHVPAPLA
ncbi:PLP-dependent aminotransferase family protein [Streptomyces sp. NPDC006552]|uniref:aminotransferase-like domain-containing protein n=1 Tax=Streptomyces sp. NPDC006552 TaxID=3157179 RepID=UPI0033B9C6FC